jgi:hypothetical protein
MTESIIKLLEVGLSLWLSKEKTKYQDKFLKLKREYYEEFNKDPAVRSDAVLDNVRFELRILADSFALAASPGKQDVANQP